MPAEGKLATKRHKKITKNSFLRLLCLFVANIIPNLRRSRLKRILILLSVTAFFIGATILAQGPVPPPQREAPAPGVSFDRLLKANQEPQNWLTYGGSL